MSSVLDNPIETTESAFIFARPEFESTVLMAVDIGSSGVRAALFDESANELTRVTNSTRPSKTKNAAALLEVVVDVIDELLAPVPSGIELQFIAISCYWHSLLGIDGQGAATTSILDWSETRAADAALALRTRFSETEIHSRTGCRLHPSYWPAKLLWLKTECASEFRATNFWVSFNEYLTHHLFGETSTSISMASATGLMNVTSCEWDLPFLEQLEIGPEKLPQIAAETITNATLRKAFADRWPQLRNARLCPGIGDGAANNIGAGCTNKTMLALMVGTSGAARVLYQGEPPLRLGSSLWCYRVDRQRVIVGGAISDGGGLFERLRTALIPDSDFEELSFQLSQMEADAHGLTVLPFWSGERSTGWAPKATGGIIGIKASTTPIQILRATMEAIAFRLSLIVAELNTILSTTTIIASGNALHSSPLWLQIITDVIGRQIMLSETREASTRGAALLALDAAGKIRLNDQSNRCAEVFEPDFSEHAKYLPAIQRQQQLYDAVSGLF